MPIAFLIGAAVGGGTTIYFSTGVKAASKYLIAGGAIYVAGKLAKAW